MNPDSRSHLTRLWVESQSSILAFIVSSVGNFADSEDILQQVAQDVAASFDRYDPDRPFIAWALVIAKRRVADYYRGRRRDIQVFVDVDLDLLAKAHTERASRWGANGAYEDLLEGCIKRLPERSRQLIELRYRDELKPAEIANAIGRSAGSIRVALTKIRKVLEQCISRKAQSEARRV